MDLQTILQHIKMLSPEDRKVLGDILNHDNNTDHEEYYQIKYLTLTDEWKEMIQRAEEVIKEQKSCLIHFDDHIQSFTHSDD